MNDEATAEVLVYWLLWKTCEVSGIAGIDEVPGSAYGSFAPCLGGDAAIGVACFTVGADGEGVVACCEYWGEWAEAWKWPKMP